MYSFGVWATTSCYTFFKALESFTYIFFKIYIESVDLPLKIKEKKNYQWDCDLVVKRETYNLTCQGSITL